MAENLSLYNPRTHRTHIVTVLSTERVDNVAEDVTIHKILVSKSIYESLGKIVSLVCKKPRLLMLPKGEVVENQTGSYDYSGIYWGIWRRLQDAGLPVVPNIWITSKYQVAMTDLTVHGGYFYDRRDAGIVATPWRKSFSTDPLFLQIGRETIEKMAGDVLERATQQKITISTDDPMALLIKPNGDMQIYLLDIGLTTFDDPDANWINSICLEKFMRSIDRIRKRLPNNSLP